MRPLTRQELWRNRGLAAFIFLFAAGAASVGSYLTRITSLKVAESTVGWPHVSGVITESRIEDASCPSGSRSFGWRFIFHYTYSVNGKEYVGFLREAPLYDGPWTEDVSVSCSTTGGGSLVADYPVGKTVDVFYDPADPSRGILIRGVPHGKVAATGTVVTILYGFAAVITAMGLVILLQREAPPDPLTPAGNG